MRITRFIHANVVCSSLSDSLHFYVDVLGATLHQPLDDGGVDLRPCLGVDNSGASQYRAALVYFAEDRGGTYLDLLEWIGPDQPDQPDRRKPLEAQDLGLARIALEVDDLDAWAEHLAAHSVPLAGPLQDASIGPWALRLLVCRDPDGTLVELAEFPHGTSRKAASAKQADAHAPSGPHD